MVGLGSQTGCSSLHWCCKQQQALLPARRALRNRRQLVRAAAREPVDDTGGGSASAAGSAPSSFDGEQLRRLRQRMAVHAERMELYAQQQDFQAAAAERDAFRQLELRARHLELAEATAQQQAAGIQHPLGAVIRHRCVLGPQHCYIVWCAIRSRNLQSTARQGSCTHTVPRLRSQGPGQPPARTCTHPNLHHSPHPTTPLGVTITRA